MKKLTLGSLFAGIGGFDLAAKWAGIDTIWQVEIDPFCQKVLEKHFPNAKRYKDITKIKGGELESVDIISGGFPCQPFSKAGKRKGKTDDRYLWPEMFRIIKDVKPKYVICENVIGIIDMAIEQVLSDLGSANYKTECFDIPACGIGAPHRRERIWIITYSTGKRWDCLDKNQKKRLPGFNTKSYLKRWDSKCNIPIDVHGVLNKPMCGSLRNDDGLSKGMDRLKSLGNAIVPQIAYQFFEIINMLEDHPSPP